MTERVNRPEPVYQPPLPVADRAAGEAFLVSRRMAAILALACVLGLLGIVSANPFASASVSERVSDKLAQPATCTERGATISANSHQSIYRCLVGGKTRRSAQCFAISGARYPATQRKTRPGLLERPAQRPPCPRGRSSVDPIVSCPAPPPAPTVVMQNSIPRRVSRAASPRPSTNRSASSNVPGLCLTATSFGGNSRRSFRGSATRANLLPSGSSFRRSVAGTLTFNA